MHTFKRGIFPNEKKEHTRLAPVNFRLPATGCEMIFPLLQHMGAKCEPLVKKGQKVFVGEKIADSDAYISAPIHSSVSGTIKDIAPCITIMGTVVDSVIIENDGEFTDCGGIKKRDGYEKLSGAELISIIREAGIVGLGGAGFPTHVKLSPPKDKKIDTILVNGCECEPYLTTDNQIMVEEAEKIIVGLQIIQKIIPGAAGVIAIEDNKPVAIETMQKACEDIPNIKVIVMKSKYPQGSEKQLINAATKRKVPSGGLPGDVGCIVNNVDTVIAIQRAVFRGRPLMRKVVTLTGDAIKNPGNYHVHLGTQLSDLVDMVGGLACNPKKIVTGGPLMGVAIFDTRVPIVKTTGGVLFLTEKEAYIPPEGACIRCGSCVDRCPMGLIPIELNTDVLRENNEAFVAHDGLECIECGSCSYICPSKRRLSQSIRTIRRAELAKRKSGQGA